MGKLSPEVTDEGAESDITSIGAHSSVAFRDTFPIIGKAFDASANTPINQNLKQKEGLPSGRPFRYAYSVTRLFIQPAARRGHSAMRSSIIVGVEAVISLASAIP